jgi:hypothetical protein
VASEGKMLECREQMMTMEREVSKLIADLAECLGPNDSSEIVCLEEGTCAQAKELTRGFAKIVREHEKCRENREDLLNEIEQLSVMNRAHTSA